MTQSRDIERDRRVAHVLSRSVHVSGSKSIVNRL